MTYYRRPRTEEQAAYIQGVEQVIAVAPIGLPRYDTMLARQQGRCADCGEIPDLALTPVPKDREHNRAKDGPVTDVDAMELICMGCKTKRAGGKDKKDLLDWEIEEQEQLKKAIQLSNDFDDWIDENF